MIEFSHNRRRFLLLSTAGGCTGIAGLSRSVTAAEAVDKQSIAGKKSEILKSAYDCGVEFCRKYGSCSRGSVAALQEALPFVPKDTGIIKAASCVNGGATPTKMASCGAFTGCGLVIGCVYGKETFEKTDLSQTLMHKLHGKFVEQYGSVLCHGVRLAADSNCVDVVGKASQWTAEILIDNYLEG